MEIEPTEEPPRIRRHRVRMLMAGVIATSSIAVIAVTASASTIQPKALDASTTYAMLIPAVQGEGSSLLGPNSIEINSFQFGVSNNAKVTGSSNSAGRPSATTVTITKSIDRATPSLFQACTTGAHYKTVTLEMRKAGVSSTAPPPSLTITLSNVLVVSDAISGPGDDGPIESVSLNFTKITYSYDTGTPGVAPVTASFTL
jgi:type VI secretion system secreted protein Hcp